MSALIRSSTDVLTLIAGFGLIAPVLGEINAEIGPSPNINWCVLCGVATSTSSTPHV